MVLVPKLPIELGNRATSAFCKVAMNMLKETVRTKYAENCSFKIRMSNVQKRLLSNSIELVEMP